MRLRDLGDHPGYRLAPGHPFPAALEDAVFAIDGRSTTRADGMAMVGGSRSAAFAGATCRRADLRRSRAARAGAGGAYGV
jgi:acetyl esterase/lipase